MVAMTPLLTIQALGIVYAAKEQKAAKAITGETAAPVSDRYVIIEL